MGSGERTRAMLMNAAERTSSFLARRRDHAVCGRLPGALLQDRLDSYDFDAPRQIEAVMDDILELLAGAAVRSDHPRYFGLFNPPALPEGIVGDLLAAAVNPQLAVWSHAPAAAEVERKLLQWFGTRIGWDLEETAGMFTSGGTEANHTALIAALSRRYPGWPRSGLAGTAGRRPVVYVSSEAHLAWIKITRSVGLGSDSVRLIPTADGLRLDAETAKSFLLQEPHLDPVLFVATAGTTAHGAVDDIRGLAALARSRQAHFHVDAAWAGGAVVSDALRRLLPGIELADSVTIYAAILLAVPMGAGMISSSDRAALEARFSVGIGYIPTSSVKHRAPYIHSLRWFSRFIELKLFMALATLGKQGYSELVERQV